MNLFWGEGGWVSATKNGHTVSAGCPFFVAGGGGFLALRAGYKDNGAVILYAGCGFKLKKVYRQCKSYFWAIFKKFGDVRNRTFGQVRDFF